MHPTDSMKSLDFVAFTQSDIFGPRQVDLLLIATDTIFKYASVTTILPQLSSPATKEFNKATPFPWFYTASLSLHSSTEFTPNTLPFSFLKIFWIHGMLMMLPLLQQFQTPSLSSKLSKILVLFTDTSYNQKNQFTFVPKIKYPKQNLNFKQQT